MKILFTRFLDWAFNYIVGPIVIRQTRKKDRGYGWSMLDYYNNGEKDKNNGGATGYYATPKNNVTLNDLIEHKKMEFWRGEVFKAAYAIEGRVEKNIEECPILSELREVNKILYYGNRRKVVLLAMLEEK